MTEIGLVSCTKTKLEQPAPPAGLYAPSPLFSKARQYCEQNHDDWFILWPSTICSSLTGHLSSRTMKR
ncbi:DUF6884 domain-containing protein [Natronococcus jeotgali]|uniref:DUF6884 domain-containing protein n=1 Tax=Natronococcus jeotgali TaxID=413812 RepID=UPI00373AE2A2